jgi:hypothetical protein
MGERIVTVERKSADNAKRRAENEKTVRELVGKVKVADNKLGAFASELKKAAKKQ